METEGEGVYRRANGSESCTRYRMLLAGPHSEPSLLLWFRSPKLFIHVVVHCCLEILTASKRFVQATGGRCTKAKQKPQAIDNISCTPRGHGSSKRDGTQAL